MLSDGQNCYMYLVLRILYLLGWNLLKTCDLITKTRPWNIQVFPTLLKVKILSRNFLYIFLSFAQNIDCGYTLELPRQGGSMFWSKNKKKQVYPCIPQFCCIKVRYKEVYITRTCFPDVRAI